MNLQNTLVDRIYPAYYTLCLKSKHETRYQLVFGWGFGVPEQDIKLLSSENFQSIKNKVPDFNHTAGRFKTYTSLNSKILESPQSFMKDKYVILFDKQQNVVDVVHYTTDIELHTILSRYFKE